jgi:hypothetical protein
MMLHEAAAVNPFETDRVFLNWCLLLSAT